MDTTTIPTMKIAEMASPSGFSMMFSTSAYEEYAVRTANPRSLTLVGGGSRR